MQRDNIVVEIMRRVLTVTTGNGYDFSVQSVIRNPENEPSPDRMPLTQLFEFPEITLTESSRGASVMPIYKKEFQVVLEHWYQSATRGVTTKDITKYLKYSRQAIFSDGITLGKLCSLIEESEVSRVYRPQIGNNVVGIGQVLKIVFVEDFSKQ